MLEPWATKVHLNGSHCPYCPPEKKIGGETMSNHTDMQDKYYGHSNDMHLFQSRYIENHRSEYKGTDIRPMIPLQSQRKGNNNRSADAAGGGRAPSTLTPHIVGQTRPSSPPPLHRTLDRSIPHLNHSVARSLNRSTDWSLAATMRYAVQCTIKDHAHYARISLRRT